MKSLSLVALLAVALVCVSLCTPPLAVGQSQVKNKADYPTPTPLVVDDGHSQFKTKPNYPGWYSYGAANDQQYVLQSQSIQLAHQYAKAEGDDEKRELRKKLVQVLDQQFDAHLKEQQKELDDLEKQVARLKKLLSKRREAKETIVERRLEQLVQEADGLGWNAPGAPRTGAYFTTPNVSPMYSKDGSTKDGLFRGEKKETERPKK